MAQFLPEFATVRAVTAIGRRMQQAPRGILHTKPEEKIDDTVIDTRPISPRVVAKSRMSKMRFTQPIKVPPLPQTIRPSFDSFLNIKFSTETTEDDDDQWSESNTSINKNLIVPSSSFDQISQSTQSTAFNSSSTSAYTSASVSPRSEPPTPHSAKKIFDPILDRDGFPEIPPIATNLCKLIATIPDSAPPSLSPYTFCEEVISLPGLDFNQYLEEDTLCIRSVTLGNRFNEDTFYDFFISLTEEQYYSAFEIISNQYYKLAYIANLLRDLHTLESIPALLSRIEQECQKIFNCRTCMVWTNIPSAKMMVNHSRLMKYPHGVGFVGTAATEKRQVVAPNPTKSPLYSEEYDLPFCEDSELIVCEPVFDPTSGELYCVIMLIDKVHKSGATYMYWPQSELCLLRYFTDGLYRIFRKFNNEIKSTSHLYKIIAKYMSNQFNFIRLLTTVKTTCSQLLKCEAIDIYFREGKKVISFNQNGTRIERNAVSLSKAGIAGYVFEHNVFVHCACACDHPAFHTQSDGNYKSRSVLAVPLMSGTKVFAVIVCRAKKQMLCFTNNDVHQLGYLAAGAAPALQMSLSYRNKMNELRVALRAQDRLAALLQTAESISKETNIDILIDRILKNLCKLIEADRASLFMIDESKTHLISRVAHGTSKPILLPINQGIVGAVATSGQPINIPDVYEDSRFNSNVDKSTGYKTKSLMSIPVKNQEGDIIAVAQVMNKLSQDPFSESDVELTKAMCVFTGIALANSLVIDSAIYSSNRIQGMLGTVVMLMKHDIISSVIHHIMNVSRDLVLADRCALFMINTKKGTLQSAVQQGENHKITIETGKGIVGYVAQYNEIVNIPDAYKDPRFHSAVDQATGYRTRSILAIPVVGHTGKTIGVIEMINKDLISNGGIFTKEDEKLLLAFASFAGLTFDRQTEDNKETDVSHTIAIQLSNMMSADESNSCEPPHQLILAKDVMDIYRSHRFDVSQLSELECFKFVVTVFHDLKLSKTYKINNAKLIRFLLAIHDYSIQEKIHSWKNIIDCLQFIYYLLTSTELSTIFPMIEKLALVVAALCHNIDYESSEYTGRDIALAVLYRNRPIMEMHHCEVTTSIITNEEQNIFENVPDDQTATLWQTIFNLILSTDPSQHYEFCYKLRTLVTPQLMLNHSSHSHRLLLSQVCLQLSDVSKCVRLFPTYEKWAKTLPTKKASELTDIKIAKKQIGFILCYVYPLMMPFSIAITEFKHSLDQLDGNLSSWKRIANRKSQRS